MSVVRVPISSVAASMAALLVLTASAPAARQDAGERRSPAAATLPATVAPVEVVRSGFGAPVGVAVNVAGEVAVTDARSGAVWRMTAEGAWTQGPSGLQGPVGVAFDEAGRLVVVEQRTGRVLRSTTPGGLEPWAAGLDGPRWIATGSHGDAWVTARGVGGRGGSGAPAGGDRIAHIAASGQVEAAAGGFVGAAGLALLSPAGLVVGLRQMLGGGDRGGTRLALLPVGPDDRLGAAVRLADGAPAAPAGIAVDRLGRIVMAAGPAGGESESSDTDGPSAHRDGSDAPGLLVVRRRDGEMASWATGLQDPQGVAFEPAGHLLVVERGHSRLLRLRAAPPPVLAAELVTNQPRARVAGTAVPGARVDAFTDAALRSLVASASADEATGAFAVEVAPTPNAASRWWFTATAADGLGLVSAPVELAVRHDDRPPDVVVESPSAGAFISTPAGLRARAVDEGSGVARVAFRIDADALATVTSTDPSQPLVADVLLDPRLHAEGAHVLAVDAVDRAGNRVTSTVPITIDRTPPDTRIVSGPSGPIASGDATFVVAGSDTVSDMFDFTWRMDEGPWSAYSSDARIVVHVAASGAHRFEVKARDLAGLEDPTPSAQAFTVGGLTLTITEPAAGAIVSGGRVWVRGVVEPAGDVGVSLPLAEEWQSMMGMASVPAASAAGRFAAEFPVMPGLTGISVVARDATGATATMSVPVVVSESATPAVNELSVAPAAGFAPLAVEMGIRAGDGARLELDQDGDGTVDYSGTTLEEHVVTYATPGVYAPVVRELTPAGVVIVHRSMVEVHDRPDLEALVQALWGGFVDALASGDVARAVGFIHSARRDEWRAGLSQLPSEELAGARAMFPPVALVGVDRGSVECEIMRDADGLRYSYPVTFRMDADGRWRLWQF